jgi:hypothetical protein
LSRKTRKKQLPGREVGSTRAKGKTRAGRIREPGVELKELKARENETLLRLLWEENVRRQTDHEFRSGLQPVYFDCASKLAGR